MKELSMNTWKRLSNQEGAVAILVAVCAVVLLSLAAFVIDGGFGLVTRNELKNVADAAALAGTRVLGVIYSKMPPAEQQTYNLADHPDDRQGIINAVQGVAGQNTAGGQSIVINEADIRIGDWGRWDDAGNPDDTKPHSLKVTDTTPDAVEVTARRDETVPTGPISTFLARIMGVDSLNVTSTSANTQSAPTTVMRPTAALTGIPKVDPGDIDIPVGISKSWFTGDFCNDYIKFYPTSGTGGCAGWTSFNLNPNAHNLRDVILEQMPPFGTYQAPGLEICTAASDPDSSFEFMGGNVVTALQAFGDLYKANSVCSVGTPTPCADGTCKDTRCKELTCGGQCVWETLVPVYDAPCGDNPSGLICIVGFATVKITNVKVPPDTPDPGAQVIEGTVQCNLVEPDLRGGGADYGTKGAIPGLVQ
jgi:Flp pilus assembly protein TadG